MLVAHAPGMAGTFSPPPRVSDPDMHHGTCVTHVPWCMPGSLTSGFRWSRWRRKRPRHSRRMRNPQFSVSGQRPITQDPQSIWDRYIYTRIIVKVMATRATCFIALHRHSVTFGAFFKFKSSMERLACLAERLTALGGCNAYNYSDVTWALWWQLDCLLNSLLRECAMSTFVRGMTNEFSSQSASIADGISINEVSIWNNP